MMPLSRARWRLAVIWFGGSAILFLTLVLQSMGGAYGEDLPRAWGWALPNFLPTLALMVSVFAADALRMKAGKRLLVRRTFCTLSAWLSVFYLSMVLFSVFAQPVISAYADGSGAGRLEILESSSLWLGPLQGLVVVALGVLFFHKEEAPHAPHAVKNSTASQQ